jgi:hypothetical protein
MRLPTSKIYRAFGELDRFSDEQCERFLSVAQRPLWKWALRWMVYLLVALVVLVLGMIIVTAVFQVIFPRGRIANDPAWFPMALIATVAISGAPVFSALLLRDWMLRKLVRRVIGTRGVCRGCGYRLLGLPVSASCQVRCPECGEDSDVDPSLGELAVGTDGARTFANVE